MDIQNQNITSNKLQDQKTVLLLVITNQRINQLMQGQVKLVLIHPQTKMLDKSFKMIHTILHSLTSKPMITLFLNNVFNNLNYKNYTL